MWFHVVSKALFILKNSYLKKMDIHHQHVDKGLVSNRKKRVFSALGAPEHLILESNANSQIPPTTLLDTIISKAEQNDNDEDLPEPHELLSTLPHHAITQTTPSQIPQQAPASGSCGPGLEDKLVFYWKGGKLNLETELAKYEEDQDVGGEFNPPTADHGIEPEDFSGRGEVTMKAGGGGIQ
ncbi:hypothetical protein BDN70DRAFT_899527 [Pholiota conissans]|uniref:Uncharacterized protein n=1 Tax=Pholiota conissans TaxID=109636 RepID=A0A9P5YPW5_9AGAR|nr:hypothetical protein BDN70DRAFT_899527 [Pholiota conissans]